MSANAIETLRVAVSSAGGWEYCHHVFNPSVGAERDSALAAVKTLLEDIKAWDADLSDYCDGPLRDRVRASIRLVESGQ